jgi:SAM-dependent methyltransferase
VPLAGLVRVAGTRWAVPGIRTTHGDASATIDWLADRLRGLFDLTPESRYRQAPGHRLAHTKGRLVAHNVGTGPGEITPDGCAVDFYALLPPMGEPSIVHAAVPEGASILELGCGTGRILRPLADLGHPVLGVDESPAMLAHLTDLPTACSPIETLRLDRTFDAVLLASTMLNTQTAQRRAFLATCRRHVDPQGVVVIQQAAPNWFDTVAPAEVDHDGIRRVVQSVRRDGPRVNVVVAYHVGDRTWTHAWDSYRISQEKLAADLASAGLRFGRWLTDDHAWFTAGPVAAPSP